MVSYQEYDQLIINGEQLRGQEIMSYCHQQKELIYQDIAAFIQEWLSSNSRITIRTSGSTGPPQSLDVEKSQMIASANLTAQFFNFKRNQKALLCLPVNYIAGKMMIVRALVSGLNLIPVNPSSNPLQHLSKEERIDFAAMVPMQFQTIHDLPQINQCSTILLGGGALNPELEKAAERCAIALYQSYGMTETLSHIAIRALNGSSKSNVYTTLPCIEIGHDDRGCLSVLAPALHHGLLITNDLVTILDDRTFILIGRIDNVVNSGGIKLFPESLESKIQPFVPQRFFFAGLPDPQLGQQLIMVIEGKSDNEFVQSLREIIAQKLEKYERPKAIYFTEVFTLTESGKLNRPKTIENILAGGRSAIV